MKLRLNGNSLRLRLTRPEVMGLCETGTVERSVDFGLGTVLIYRIQSRDVTAPIHAVFCNHSITIRVPAESVAIWAAANEVGLYGQQGALNIAVEKDFRCLNHRPDEEDLDAYPRPANEPEHGTGEPPCQL
jgi:hypothetical protein